MKSLFILRGSPRSGKSTWVEGEGMGPYTLCPDTLRLLHQSPVMGDHGFEISQKNDKKVWDLLFSILEDRMGRGELCVIDATHSKESDFNRYKHLCEAYRYRAYCIDFTGVPMEVCLQRNNTCVEHKRVPPEVILNQYSRFETQNVPSWVRVIKPEEFKDVIAFPPKNVDEYKRIAFIGDIHGCSLPLLEYFEKYPYEENVLYVFLGDYLDRGPHNAEVLKFLLSIYSRKNVILLEGNHEAHLRKWASDEAPASDEFLVGTMPQLDNANIDKKECRQLCRSLHQIAYLSYKGEHYLANHAGVPFMPKNLLLTASLEFVKQGRYASPVDALFTENGLRNGDRTVQIHGHRNLMDLPIHAAELSYNLNDNIELGAFLRVLHINEDGTRDEIKIKHNIPEGDSPSSGSSDKKDSQAPLPSGEALVSMLRDFPGRINESKYGHISSFNFSRDVFKSRDWSALTLTARGLYLNNTTGDVVARGYNKFFNWPSEVSTKEVLEKIEFPVSVFLKENGFLGLLGYDSTTDNLILGSKSRLDGDHAKYFQTKMSDHITEANRDEVKNYLKQGYCAVFEVIDNDFDPHIIKYESPKIVLLDAFKRDVGDHRCPIEKSMELSKLLNIPFKELRHTFNTPSDLVGWLQTTEKSEEQIEGYVAEGANGFMFKIKLPYYKEWKALRWAITKIASGHYLRGGVLNTPLMNRVVGFAKTLKRDQLRDLNIITLRDLYLKSK